MGIVPRPNPVRGASMVIQNERQPSSPSESERVHGRGIRVFGLPVVLVAGVLSFVLNSPNGWRNVFSARFAVALIFGALPVAVIGGAVYGLIMWVIFSRSSQSTTSRGALFSSVSDVSKASHLPPRLASLVTSDAKQSQTVAWAGRLAPKGAGSSRAFPGHGFPSSSA